MKFFSQLIKIFINDTAKYNSIKNSNNAEKSVYFGIVAILSAVLGCAACAGLVYGGVSLLENIGGDGFFVAIFAIIFGAALALGGVLGFILSSIRGILASIYQLRLKRKVLGIIAIIINIAVLVSVIVLIVLIIKS